LDRWGGNWEGEARGKLEKAVPGHMKKVLLGGGGSIHSMKGDLWGGSALGEAEKGDSISPSRKSQTFRNGRRGGTGKKGTKGGNESQGGRF